LALFSVPDNTTTERRNPVPLINIQTGRRRLAGDVQYHQNLHLILY